MEEPEAQESTEDLSSTANLKAQIDVISQETCFLKKYFVLRKRCEQIQQVHLFSVAILDKKNDSKTISPSRGGGGVFSAAPEVKGESKIPKLEGFIILPAPSLLQ